MAAAATTTVTTVATTMPTCVKLEDVLARASSVLPQDLSHDELLRWLERMVAHALATSSVFPALVAVYKLRIAHAEELAAAKHVLACATAAFESSQTHEEIVALRRAIEQEQQARQAHAAFIAQTDPPPPSDKVLRAAARLARAEAELASLQAELAALEEASETLHAVRKAEAYLAALSLRLGITEAEHALSVAHRALGPSLQSVGTSFESRARSLWRELILPVLLQQHHPHNDVDIDSIVALKNVTLGVLGMEFDLLIVRPSLPAVDVLAVVEVKKRISDIGISFAQHRKMIRWLCG